MLFWLLTGLTSLLVFITLFPFWRHEAWWVRMFDFPRLQFTCFACCLLVLDLSLLSFAQAASWALLISTSGCFICQAWWIFPYTPFYRKEVKQAAGVHPDNRLCILTANVLTPNRQADKLLQMVEHQQPHILVLVETDEWWQSRLDTLEPAYPHTLKCPLDNLYGMHLYSRLPLEDAEIQFLVEEDIPSMHTLVVLLSGQRVRLHCLHPAPPSPTENAESTERDAELVAVGKSLAETDLPAVVTGDLNDVVWSETTRLFRKISGLLDPRVGRGMYNTFHARFPFMRWPLDHLYHTPDFSLIKVARLGYFGSDHFPILVELELKRKQIPSNGGLEAERADEQWADEKMASMNVTEDLVHAPGE